MDMFCIRQGGYFLFHTRGDIFYIRPEGHIPYQTSGIYSMSDRLCSTLNYRKMDIFFIRPNGYVLYQIKYMYSI